MTATLTNGTAQRAAAERYLSSVDAGDPLTGRELAAEFERSESWGRDVIRGTREVEVAARPPAAAPTANRHWLDETVRLVVAVVAAAASYGHMYQVALWASEPLWIARAWPITVDGLAFAALRRGDAGRWWLILSLAVSVGANVLSHYPDVVAQLAPAIAAWPPLALLGTHWLVQHRSPPT